MKVGTRVKMSERLKEQLRANGSGEHADEFEGELGTVIPNRPGCEDWPEVDVKWDCGLRYMYDPKDLDVVED